ncbi:MAG TPA: hypothetical protein GX710_00740 [Clostridiales bacterium]|nr:hypothetical protein [Clostridiales bacterium]
MVVKAIAGRDKGKFFVVKDVESSFAYIVNGKSRKYYTPKKKSLKHLRITNTVIEMAELTDKKLRKMLNEYSQHNTTDDGGSNFV